jgi:hypothetical protein
VADSVAYSRERRRFRAGIRAAWASMWRKKEATTLTLIYVCRISHVPSYALTQMVKNWHTYSRQGLDFASAASSFGFSAVKSGTRLVVSRPAALTELITLKA